MVEHQPQVDEVFGEALRHAAGPDRIRYLAEACGDNVDLRRRVERLLRAVSEAGSFLEAPARDPSPTVDQPPVENPGATIGPYKLLELIGEGGMGAVWMAQQTDPVKRLVAVKLIKAGMDSKQIIARFEAERQALALMDHPNIAKVLDAGTTPPSPPSEGGEVFRSPPCEGGVRGGGRPYFVMELVKGVPITNYCDEHHLTPRQRLELFIPVCQAVQHAHQKGIIHRDLKPSNVLIALYDGKPVPKVIDFGVAKAMGQPLTEQTLVTGFGAVVGTLEYMSPEQAELNNHDIDTRSDIYSLGVLLYELLTGTTPLEHKRVQESGLLEALRIIREEEVPTLSNRLSSTAELPAIAANRGTEPAKLTKLVRGELDWIVMKALEKDRNPRYETANALVLDVQRYLSGEPVLAVPPSVGYRLRKFARRHLWPVVASSLVVLVLVAGVIGTTIGLVRERLARLDAAEQRERADKNYAASQASLEAALRLVQKSLIRVNEEMKSQPHLEAQRKRLLDEAVSFCRGLLEHHGTDPRLRKRTALAHYFLAEAYGGLGQIRESELHCQHASLMFTQLHSETPGDWEAAYSLGSLHRMVGGIEREQGKLLEARERYLDAIQLFEAARTIDDRPRVSVALVVTLSELGTIERRLKCNDEAGAHYDRALALAAKLEQQSPEEPSYRLIMSQAQQEAAPFFAERGEYGRHDEAFRQALQRLERLTTESTENAQYRVHLALAQFNLGLSFNQRGLFAESIEANKAALANYEHMVTLFPKVPYYHSMLAATLNNLVRARREQIAAQIRQTGKSDRNEIIQLRAMLERAIRHQQVAFEAAPQVTDYRDRLKTHYVVLTDLHLLLVDHRSAAQALQEPMKLYPDDSRMTYWAGQKLAACYMMASRDPKLSDQERTELVTRYEQDAVECLRRALQKGPYKVADLKEDNRLSPLNQGKAFEDLLAQYEPRENKTGR